MKYAKRAILSIFAILMIGSGLALDVGAQRRGNVVAVRRQVIVRRAYVRPYRGYGYTAWHSPYWGYGGLYDPYWESPYLRYQDRKFRLQSELRGNERELAKHQEKYRADGVITAKERRELEDDISDVQKSRAKLNKFLRDN